MITVRGAAGPAMRVVFEDVELTVANDTTVLHGSDGDQAALYGDPSAGPGSGPRSCRGAPNAGNTHASLHTGARSGRPVAISISRSIVPRKRGAATLDRGGGRWVAGPHLQVLLWAGPAGTAARSEVSARTSQRTARAGWYGGPHTAPTSRRSCSSLITELLRRTEHLL